MRKKKSAEPKMGYYPFEHWLGRTSRLGAQARGPGRCAQAGAGARRRALGCWSAGALARWRTGVRGARERKKRGGHAGEEEARGARGRQAGARGRARRAGVAGARRACCRQAGAHEASAGCMSVACVHLGVLAGLWAVHLVHSACFWPGLTRYFSGVRFF